MSNQPLKVIGAGFGRTGTESTKAALEQLGFGKCYHMFELMKKPERLPEWEKLARGETPNYDALFAGYQSCLDFPAALYYREFMRQYPEAKVILTVRDADKWYDSAAKTILADIPAVVYPLARFLGIFSRRLGDFPKVDQFARRVVHQGLFQGRAHEREYTKAVFNAWNEEVKRTVPPDRLLIFEVREGWESLCNFLGVPVPAAPFPRLNAGDSFVKSMAKKMLTSEKSG
ncbi:MAG: sulfotransferase family protein [Anaerolineales bacterium]|nr:sulfotransferase family protein [Anaerolineales bacterium]